MRTQALLLAQMLRVMATLSASRRGHAPAAAPAVHSVLEVAVREGGGLLGTGDGFVLFRVG